MYLQESGRKQVPDDEEEPVQSNDDRVQKVPDMQAKSPSARYGRLKGQVFITNNEPVDYMARAVMILMRGKDIARAIGRVGP